MSQLSSKIKSSTSPMPAWGLTVSSSFASGFPHSICTHGGKFARNRAHGSVVAENFLLFPDSFLTEVGDCGILIIADSCRCGGMVDTGDLKSPGSNTVPVRVRSPAPRKISYRGVEQLVARRAHNPEVVGSSPASATKKMPHRTVWHFSWIPWEIEMLGRNASALRQGFRFAKTLERRRRAAGQKAGYMPLQRNFRSLPEIRIVAH